MAARGHAGTLTNAKMKNNPETLLPRRNKISDKM